MVNFIFQPCWLFILRCLCCICIPSSEPGCGVSITTCFFLLQILIELYCNFSLIVFTFLLLFRKRVFILGPSHHVRIRGCALSIADKYETPLYDLQIDTQINAELEKTGKFSWMDMNTDEDEHSIEMHLPYIAKVMEEWVDSYFLFDTIYYVWLLN